MDRTVIMLRSILKILRGFELEWIGVKLAIPHGLPRSFEVELAADKVDKLKEALRGLLDQPMVPVKILQRTTGVLGWLSSIIPEVRPWLAMLWAVLTQALHQEGPKRERTRERKGLVFRRQLEHAARFLLALLCNLNGPTLRHTYRLQPQEVRWFKIETDACPTGMGAVLYFVGKPLMFWADTISDADLGLLKAERIPDYQTEFEMYTIFLSLKVFLPLVLQPFAIFLRTDNSASLHACLTYKAKSPLLTHLTAEFMLEFLCNGWIPPRGEHVAGVLNDTADSGRVGAGETGGGASTRHPPD